MAHVDESNPFGAKAQEHASLAREWRRMTRAATMVAVFTAPAFFLVLFDSDHAALIPSLLVAVAGVILFRGLVEVIVRKLIPSASLLGAGADLREEDIVARRRHWFWLRFFRRVPVLVLIAAVLLGICQVFFLVAGVHASFLDPFSGLRKLFPNGELAELIITMSIQLPLLLVSNFLIFFGPLMYMAVRSIKSYEPGDASWGVKLQDVRGQSEAKEEIARVISLWQSGDEFELAGGKRERGLLFLGAPGTGKTMISKAIATSFNCPFVTIPGSGFAQMFIGMDVITVTLMARRARKLARKWGGQCIVFIDEIDAVGLRRQALSGGDFSSPGAAHSSSPFGGLPLFGRDGSLTPTGDLVGENGAWRDHVFTQRDPGTRIPTGGLIGRLTARVGVMMPGMGGMGGGQALNSLLVVMDGMGEPPAFKKWWTSRLNTWMDATFLVPQRIGKVKLRLPPAKPRGEEIYFIGACNVPIDALDPALTRPGRMGRHIWFHTPGKEDRKDIFDLYLTKVDHEPDMDTERGREELANVTMGYSPAMIEQVCSMALTVAHAENRPLFSRHDILEAMFTVEAGTAQNIEYVPEESLATAIHEAGHAAASHVYLGHETLSVRLTIRKRGDAYGMYAWRDREERHIKFRSSLVGTLITTLGAMAAEHVCYGENSQGVGGDLFSATALAAHMVGAWGMGPEPMPMSLRVPAEDPVRGAQELGVGLGASRMPAGLLPAPTSTNGGSNGHHAELAEVEHTERRLAAIGNHLMNRASSGGSAFQSNPMGAVLGSPDKRRSVAILLGQAYVTAYSLMRTNKTKIQAIAQELVARKEIFGDDLTALLDGVDLRAPDIDLSDDATWPAL